MKFTSHTRAFEMTVPVDRLFPLFRPEGERHWVPGCDYENLLGTTELPEDYIFLTTTHDHGATDAIWIVKQYDREAHFVQFYKIEPEDKIGVVTVKCTELEAERTTTQMTYKYMALSATGEKFISEFSKSAYEEFIDEWQSLLCKYLEPKGEQSIVTGG